MNDSSIIQTISKAMGLKEDEIKVEFIEGNGILFTPKNPDLNQKFGYYTFKTDKWLYTYAYLLLPAYP